MSGKEIIPLPDLYSFLSFRDLQPVPHHYSKFTACGNQWRNRRGGGSKVPPETSDQEISADLSGKTRQGKMQKGENGEEKKENCKKGRSLGKAVEVFRHG